jgi:surface protein
MFQSSCKRCGLVLLLLLIPSFLTIPLVAQNFSIAENGITVVCIDAEIGETSEINGKTYIAADLGILQDSINVEADLSSICTSKITNMYRLFYNSLLNREIQNWDVSNVTEMSSMFRFAINFNRDISSWNTSNVISMSTMFDGATAFNQDISSWDISSVRDMSFMFNDAS